MASAAIPAKNGSAMGRASEGSQPRGYRAVWRWHFIAALWTAPLLLILTISGAIYIFDRQIDGWWNRDKLEIAAEGPRLPLARQEALVRNAYPGAQLVRVRLPREADEASVWNIALPDGRALDVYLDPYRGKVTGTEDPDLEPMVVVRKIHGTLLGGEIGSLLVELVACWTLVMMATGIWLWWPRRWKLKGVFVPRMATGGRRMWRDLHAVPSVLNAVLVILLILTGLPWSAFWGVQFAKIGEYVPLIAPSPNFHGAPQIDPAKPVDPHAMHAQHQHRPDPEEAKLPWTIRNSSAPQGSIRGAVGIAEMEKLLPLLDRKNFGEGVRIFYPNAQREVFTISYVPDKAEGQRTVHVDPGTGRIVANIGWADYSPVAQWVEWGTMLHMGLQYGLANQLANLAVCLVLVGSVVAGLILWWRRRPKGSWGAPSVPEGQRFPAGLKALIAALAVLFPLVAASFIPVLVWSAWDRRNAPAT
ncbi:MAG TPA: PepSY domain-containing protein [Sphingomonadaceae bacterium]|nr:PepSY domain-containing protein [Sphingomonadaceae bacterium]